ncbi:pyridoxamine 5'-phosphate oxidase family protein [Sphingomonas fuzhouensis]|uniref:pyridoxamine 5'-phosphate oxidase family protein n=1 Tax=Sphingomonas fuzhouensis TaxID=3106033 RepID=UPI002AFFE21B|nr:pyridoxamine 5'-phosphate oxidase family protein [Sphingomonas sp. SGZ-02]
MSQDTRHDAPITTIAALEALYGPVSPPSIVKVADHIHPVYRPFIEASPFAVLATAGAAGLDATPRGDPAGFVHIEDDRTLLLPDRRGNNRIDSLRNIIADPRVALLFLIPGIGETLRVNGTADILAGPELLARFAMAGQLPKSVLRISVASVFFQCSRAVIRAGLWKPDSQVARETLPSAGTMLRTLSTAEIDGDAYDRALPKRLADTLY